MVVQSSLLVSCCSDIAILCHCCCSCIISQLIAALSKDVPLILVIELLMQQWHQTLWLLQKLLNCFVFFFAAFVVSLWKSCAVKVAACVLSSFVDVIVIIIIIPWSLFFGRDSSVIIPQSSFLSCHHHSCPHQLLWVFSRGSSVFSCSISLVGFHTVRTTDEQFSKLINPQKSRHDSFL